MQNMKKEEVEIIWGYVYRGKSLNVANKKKISNREIKKEKVLSFYWFLFVLKMAHCIFLNVQHLTHFARFLLRYKSKIAFQTKDCT